VETGVLEHFMFALQYYVPVTRARIQQFGITIRAHYNDAQPIRIPGIITIVLHFRRIEPMMVMQRQPSNRMPAEFNYVLVSDVDNGMQFTNICNQELHFQEGEPYEVCMQDMLFTFNGWDNVRDGINTITVKRGGGRPDVILRVPPGKYTSKKKLVEEINKLLITLRPGYFRPTPNSEPKSYYPELVWHPAVPAVPLKWFRHWSAGGAEVGRCEGHMLGDVEQPPKPAIPEALGLQHVVGIPESVEFTKLKARWLLQLNDSEENVRKKYGGKLGNYELDQMDPNFSHPEDVIPHKNITTNFVTSWQSCWE
jgi:hypothetical protein